MSEKINCFHCVHFSVTWDTKFPKGCGLFNFKSAGMPSAVVRKSTGSPCNGFKQK
ncbi:MAG: uracil-DNA glycosylase [Oscillospiraceae bacterium]|nr:uracil-DNA glycosylase [Oscillospiraceae bacterium]